MLELELAAEVLIPLISGLITERQHEYTKKRIQRLNPFDFRADY